MTGQIGWAPIEDTINGTIVFDGSFSGGGEAELGVLKTPVRLTVEKGVIKDVQGGAEAKFIAKWLASFNDERMYQMAHISYGFNPGSGDGLCTEDERVWGCTEWGIGYQVPCSKGLWETHPLTPTDLSELYRHCRRGEIHRRGKSRPPRD